MPCRRRHRVSCKTCRLGYNKVIKRSRLNVALQVAKYNEPCFLYKDFPESTDEIYLSILCYYMLSNEKLQVLLFMLEIRRLSDRAIMK